MAKLKPARQIIHILDFHFVDEKAHEIDIRDAAKADGVTLTDEEVLAELGYDSLNLAEP